MRIFIKNNIVGFILGTILFVSIGVVAYTLNANQVSYTPMFLMVGTTEFVQL